MKKMTLAQRETMVINAVLLAVFFACIAGATIIGVKMTYRMQFIERECIVNIETNLCDS
jgi:hypothetical protein